MFVKLHDSSDNEIFVQSDSIILFREYEGDVSERTTEIVITAHGVDGLLSVKESAEEINKIKWLKTIKVTGLKNDIYYINTEAISAFYTSESKDGEKVTRISISLNSEYGYLYVKETSEEIMKMIDLTKKPKSLEELEDYAILEGADFFNTVNTPLESKPVNSDNSDRNFCV